MSILWILDFYELDCLFYYSSSIEGTAGSCKTLIFLLKSLHKFKFDLRFLSNEMFWKKTATEISYHKQWGTYFIMILIVLADNRFKKSLKNFDPWVFIFMPENVCFFALKQLVAPLFLQWPLQWSSFNVCGCQRPRQASSKSQKRIIKPHCETAA